MSLMIRKRNVCVDKRESMCFSTVYLPVLGRCPHRQMAKHERNKVSEWVCRSSKQKMPLF